MNIKIYRGKRVCLHFKMLMDFFTTLIEALRRWTMFFDVIKLNDVYNVLHGLRRFEFYDVYWSFTTFQYKTDNDYVDDWHTIPLNSDELLPMLYKIFICNKKWISNLIFLPVVHLGRHVDHPSRTLLPKLLVAFHRHLVMDFVSFQIKSSNKKWNNFQL